MANLKFSFPGYLQTGYGVTVSTSAYDGTSVYNLGTGERYSRYRTESSQTGLSIETNLFSNGTPDHFIVARADLLSDNCSQLVLEYSGSYTTLYADLSFPGTLTGPRSQDYLATFSGTASTIFKISYLGSSGRFLHSKAYLGAFFEMNVELDDYDIDLTLGSGEPFYSGDHTSHFARTTEPKYTGALTWRGVTDAKVKALNALLENPNNRYCFLYTPSVTEVLDGVELLHVKITKFTYRRIHPDWNLVNVSYEELIG